MPDGWPWGWQSPTTVHRSTNWAIARQFGVLPLMRIDLMTLGLLDPHSNQLSYKGLCNMIKLGELKIFAKWNWTVTVGWLWGRMEFANINSSSSSTWVLTRQKGETKNSCKPESNHWPMAWVLTRVELLFPVQQLVVPVNMRKKCPLSHLRWPSKPTSIKTRPWLGSFLQIRS